MSVAIATAQNYENFSNQRSCELLFFCKSTIFLYFYKRLSTFFLDKLMKLKNGMNK